MTTTHLEPLTFIDTPNLGSVHKMKSCIGNSDFDDFHIYATLNQLLQIGTSFRKVVVMSPSWNFPARAEPSYEVSEPSWGTLISELKPS